MEKIPDHVRLAAMNAVQHPETMAQLREFTGSETFPETSQDYAKPKDQPCTAEIRKAAMNAIDHPETKAQIRLMAETGSVMPSEKTIKLVETVAALEKSRHNAGTIQATKARENFGGKDEIG